MVLNLPSSRIIGPTLASFAVTKIAHPPASIAGSSVLCLTTITLSTIQVKIRRTQLISSVDNQTAQSPNQPVLRKNTSTINAVSNAMTIREIQIGTRADDTMQMVIQAIETNNWSEYKKVSDEQSVHQGNILRQLRIVMSSFLRRREISLAHIGHQVIIKTKRLLRSKVWFPNIVKMVEETVRDCLPW